jgi:branched-chain amino acid transport system substrate-binding protein
MTSINFSTRTVSSALLAFGAYLLVAQSAAAQVACGVAEGTPATGEPIKVGAITSATGPADFSSSTKAVKAYFACINANGGIAGRPIEYSVEDDGWAPEKSTASAAKLIDDRKVVALVGSSSFVDCAANAAFYDKSNVISLAGAGIPRECYYSASIAPTSMGPRLSSVSIAAYAAKTYGTKRYVCFGTNIPNLGDWVCGGISEWGRENNVEVKTILVNPGNLDATSLVLEAAAFKPDAVVIALDLNAGLSLLNVAEEQDLGRTIHWLGTAALYDQDFPKALSEYWNDNIVVQTELAPIDSTGTDNVAWKQLMDEYGSPSDPRDTFSQSGFLAARAFVSAVSGLSAADLDDRAKVTDALRNMQPVTSDLLCNPFKVGKGTRHNANMDGRVASISDGAWKVAAECSPTPDPALADIRGN